MKQSYTKRLTIAALCMSAFMQNAGALEPKPNMGERKKISFADLQAGFANPPLAYAPFMFWFWDTPLTPEEEDRIRALGGT